MRLYFAGCPVSEGNERMLCTIAGARHRLLSFADVSLGRGGFAFWASSRAPGPFFLDSGAYSAHTQGTSIGLREYCDFIAARTSNLRLYASLDVIGDWRASAQNYEAMRASGLAPVPTFHLGSPAPELRRLLRETEYIALGGVVGASRKQMQPWLDGCFSIIREHWPKKIHIFGVTAQWALERYPFFSADSTAALVGAGMGRVCTFGEGRLSATSWQAHAEATGDALVMDDVSPMRVKNGSAYRGRAVYNVRSFLSLERHVTALWNQRGVHWA